MVSWGGGGDGVEGRRAGWRDVWCVRSDFSCAEGEVQSRVVLSARSSDHMLGATTISLAV